MKHIYKLPFALLLTVLLMVPSLLSAQQLAVTKDGREVFLQSDINKLPAAEQKELLSSDHVIVIQSKKDLQKVKDQYGLLEDARKMELDREKNIRAKSEEVLQKSNFSEADAKSFIEMSSFAKNVISKFESMPTPAGMSQDERAAFYFKNAKTNYGYENDDPQAPVKEALEKKVIEMKAAGKSDAEIIDFISTIVRTEKTEK